MVACACGGRGTANTIWPSHGAAGMCVCLSVCLLCMSLCVSVVYVSFYLCLDLVIPCSSSPLCVSCFAGICFRCFLCVWCVCGGCYLGYSCTVYRCFIWSKQPVCRVASLCSHTAWKLRLTECAHTHTHIQTRTWLLYMLLCALLLCLPLFSLFRASCVFTCLRVCVSVCAS